tara:strand:- start:5575 stop:6204 length:630 start_codon:yes stop_codon:yes gene_type:complete
MNKELTKRILSSIILIPLALYFIMNGYLMLLSFSLICLIIACHEWHLMTKKILHKIYGFIFLFFSFYTFYQLSLELIGTFLVITICVSTDIGGYIFGKVFKGPKLTKISPNKTYAGAIGGYFLSFISLMIIINYIEYSLTIFQLISLFILISTTSQLGDIVVSYFKRKSKIKNTGKIIPGHGGLLDRIDGMVFAFPVFYLVNSSQYFNI